MKPLEYEDVAAAIASASSFSPKPRTTASIPVAGAIWRLLRPAHAVKNVFVLAPLVFATHASLALEVPRALLAFAAFCLISSAVYCFNDTLDAAADRLHPTKCNRPVASGAISPSVAIGLSVALTLLGLGGSIALLPPPFTFTLLLYLGNNLLYSWFLKNKVIADVVSIAIGFVLRLLGGAAAINVPASSWLIVCGFSLALLLGFGKRRAELLNSEGSNARVTLALYTAPKLDSLMSICGSVSLVSYMLYTVAPETAALHHTDKLVYTIPFVAYGIFRFIFKVQEGKAEDPVSILLHDTGLQANIALWVVVSLVIVQMASSGLAWP